MVEFRYTHDYSFVLFWCMWFYTQTIVISNNNFTSINTNDEAYKDDQLIYALATKQVFYIRDPARRNQNNNHRCVFGGVSHQII